MNALLTIGTVIGIVMLLLLITATVASSRFDS
jgi:hypothetical protein